MSKPWKRLFLVAVLATSCTVALSAQQPAASAPKVDEEEVFDDQLRGFGYASGAAFACVSAEKQAEVERKVLNTFSDIARLFGTDRAFFYAAAFGNGTTVKVDPAKCPEFLDKFQKATAVPGGRK